MRVLRAIDLEKLKKDRLQLWGEAAHYQSKDESLVLDKALWGKAGEEQEARRVIDPWENTLSRLQEIMPYRNYHDGVLHDGTRKIIYQEGDEEKVRTADLLQHVLDIPLGNQQVGQTMRLSNVMKKIGWDRATNGYVTIDGDRVKGYFRKVPE